MNEAEFAYLRRVLKTRSGLDLGPEKRYLAETRLKPMCRRSGLSLAELVRRLRLSGEDDLARLVTEAMATGETSFFRDRAHFEILRDVVLPRLAAARRSSRRLWIWSAACSTGQEAYSLAMLLDDLPGRPFAGWQLTILATDMSRAAIERAEAGLYSQGEVQRGLPIRHLLRHLKQSPEGWTVSPELRARVDFRVHNLLDDVRPLGRFDLILCRNVLIYLDVPTKADILARLAAALAPDGALGLGAAESALGQGALLRPDPAAPSFFVPSPRAPRLATTLRAAS